MYLEAIAPIPAYTAPADEITANRLAEAPLDRPVSTTSLSVLTYNVRGLPWPVAAGRGAALRRIGEELAALRDEGRQPDIVLIQEGFRSEMAELVRTSGYPYWAEGPGRGGAAGRLVGAGLYVLSDAPILEVRHTAYRHCAGLDCLANKGAMIVRLALPGAPGHIEVVNTHMNSRKAAKAPLAETLAAHNRQTEQLNAFIRETRDAETPLLVGGDFNVKNAPERYRHGAADRPYTVVSEYCHKPASGCGPGAPDLTAEPWLRSQDLQAFAPSPAARVRPVKIETLFDRTAGQPELSDHAGYLVRYELDWTPQAQVRQPVEVRAQMKKGWGVKVSWKR